MTTTTKKDGRKTIFFQIQDLKKKKNLLCLEKEASRTRSRAPVAKMQKRWPKPSFFSNPRFEEETSESRNPDRWRTTRTSRVRVTNYREVYFFKYSLMPAAARRPSPMARITVAAPSTMSPPA